MVDILHRPVLLKEIIDFLNLAPGKIIIDATVGGGGHASEILRRISPGGLLIGIDRDGESLEIARKRLIAQGREFKLVNHNFRDLKEIIKSLGVDLVDGILFDLGISSIQIDSEERGFSIKNLGPLDMRMDRRERTLAKDLVNNLTEQELSTIIRDLGEERFHKRIARGIVFARKKNKIQNTHELARIVVESLPYKNRHTRIHPATRTFQALRISVNDELGAIEEAIRSAPYILKKNGRLCVISFHSLEDRIAKNVLRDFKQEKYTRTLTKKPVRAGEEELLQNPRSRSAKLRVCERLM